MDCSFSTLLGGPYRGGNLLFHDQELLSAVGNRVHQVCADGWSTCCTYHVSPAHTTPQVDLACSLSTTLPFQNTKPIRVLALSPDGHLLLSVDEDGRALLTHRYGQRSCCNHAHNTNNTCTHKLCIIGPAVWCFITLRLKIKCGSPNSALMADCLRSGLVGYFRCVVRICSADKWMHGDVRTRHR